MRKYYLHNRLPGGVYLLCFATFANSLGTFLIPFLPLYLKNMGVDARMTGNAVACYGAGCLLACLFGGHISDVVGRKPVICTNLMITTVLTGIIGFITSLATIFTILFSIGICAGMSRPASNALIGDLINEEQSAAAYGLNYWSGNIGFILSSLLGGILSTYSFVLLYLVDSTTCFLAFLILVGGLSDLQSTEPKQKVSAAKNDHSSKCLNIIISTTLLAWVIQTQAWTALPLTITKEGMTSFDWGIISATNGTVIIVVQPFVNRVISIFGGKKILAAGCLIMGVGFMAVPIFSTLFGFIIQTTIWSVGESFVTTSSPVLVSAFTTSDERGKWMGFSAATFSLASIVGPASGGWAIQKGLDSILWISCGIGGILATTLALQVKVSKSLSTGEKV